MKHILKRYFGFSNFRPYQKKIVEQILNGRDCLVVMASGSGKSLCYQFPPLIAKKTAIIISPFTSLMQDQVMSLKQRGIRADHLSSAQTDSNVSEKAERGEYDILYMTPEKACLLAPSFWSSLLNSGICLLAVDEAHCISECGHDFRVEYKRLDGLRGILSNVPFVGLTATATEKVQKDIINTLKLKDAHVAVGSFDRQNLFYCVKSINRGPSFLNNLIKDISKYVENACSTIIYCTTVKDVEQISKLLHKAGMRAGMCHGQMDNKAREESHRSFIQDEFLVMVATGVYGICTDKQNIRYVIHYGCPKSVESYYQESGRCGRDGISSMCMLYFSSNDFAKAHYFCTGAHSADQRKAIMESYVAAQNYCTLTSCRRSYLLNYFGENNASDRCGNCDNCTSERKEYDMCRESFLLMSCIQLCRGRYGLNFPVDVLCGSRAKKILDAKLDKLPFHGLGKNLSVNWWKALAHQLILGGYMVKTFRNVFKTTSVSLKGLQFLSSCTPDHQPPLYLVVTSDMTGEQTEKLSAPGESHRFSPPEGELYKMLSDERAKLARSRGTAPYTICGDQTLQTIALTRPSTKEGLANIDGVNQHLMQMYGDHFLRCMQRWSQQLNLPMDAKLSTQSHFVRTVESRSEKLMPASLKAWKMWREDFFTTQQIAHLMQMYGDHFLQCLQRLSQKDVPMDEECSTQSPLVRKVNLLVDEKYDTRSRLVLKVALRSKKLMPASLRAWKMWQEDLFTIHQIANDPDREAPLREDTVIGYLLQAAIHGQQLDWPRFCGEIGLSKDVFVNIQEAISKVGNERLKLIKTELPQDVSYIQIEAYLLMQKLGVEVISSLPEKNTPANVTTWKMWQEDFLTIQQIANHPDRAAPIKEYTVIVDLLQAARDGQPLDWPRFCGEIGLSKEVFLNIREAISKVGTERLKPIKSELPEDVTYLQIKVYLLMEELGVEVVSSLPMKKSVAAVHEKQDSNTTERFAPWRMMTWW